MPETMAEKIWGRHVVRSAEGEPDLLYVDLHLVHEVTSPQAFDGLRLAGRTVRRPDLTVATMDHDVPTTPGPVEDPVAARHGSQDAGELEIANHVVVQWLQVGGEVEVAVCEEKVCLHGFTGCARGAGSRSAGTSRRWRGRRQVRSRVRVPP